MKIHQTLALIAAAALPATAALAQSTRPADVAEANAETIQRFAETAALTEMLRHFEPLAEQARMQYEAAQTEPRPFLGVATAPLDDAAREMAELPEGVGLVVQRVVEDSPAAAAGVAAGDVLHKLGDQLLVNADQLRTLVRTNAAGDDVELRVLRGGEPMTLTATLEERDVPVGPPMLQFYGVPGVLRDMPLDLPMLEPGDIPDDRLREMQRRMRELEDRMRGLDEEQDHERNDRGFSGARVDMPEATRQRLSQALQNLQQRAEAYRDMAAETRAAAGTRIVVSDDGGSARLTRDAGGAARFVVTDAEGKTLYDGPVPPKGERDDLPAEVRRRLDQVEKYAPAAPAPPVPPAPPPARPAAPADAA